MALANVAALLAGWGNKVLILDWDIEAPGIERYFLNSPSRLANSRKETDGIVDLVLAYTKGQPLDWRQCLVKAFPFGDDSKIDIITAGRERADYNGRVRQIAWVDLFEHKEFGTYLEQLRNQWITEYDFVLVDSRTGITDIGGICTIHLPDALVLFFTANWQSLQGALDVMKSAKEKHQTLPFDRRELVGIPVPSRFENITEYKRASQWKNVFSTSFSDIYRAWFTGPSSVVVDGLLIPNIPYWSFSEPFPELGEPLPVTQESTSDIRSVSHAYAVLAQLINSRLRAFEPLKALPANATRSTQITAFWFSRWLKTARLLDHVTRAIHRREQATFFVAALCFSAGFALGKLVDGKWIASLQIALYAIGAIALVYGAVRVWRLVNPPELTPAKDRPSAIKGPMAFTETDGELFRKLGRESELQKLLGLVLDDQVLMVVVRGASGAGKTSLLRAGLKHILGDGVVFHYWEAVPSEPDKGLLRAIQESWPEGLAKPAMLDGLLNPPDALGRHSHVIVLDQFEQLRGNRKIFQLLRRIVRESKPPHRIKWVIAFRREFSAEWLDFISPELESGVRSPQDVSVRLFTTEQAREVIGQLINESDLKGSIEQSVIDNLVEAATVDGEVSPVDIGIGLLVLKELHERQSGHTITNRDYQFAGGAEGLLTQYISRCLEPFPKESQEAILKAMLALRDPDQNRQRLATGLTIDELAVEARTDARVLKLQLNRLADRDVRLLEVDTPTDGSAVRYRLPHERLIPALYRLTGKLLTEVDQAKLKFQNAFQAWQTNDKRSRYLLKGEELRLVQRYETQIPWGQDEQEKKSFLFRSKRRRQLLLAATMATVLVLIGVGWFSTLQYQRFENTRYVTESGYPAELYDFQHQLKKLEMTEPLDLEHFTWLSSNSIEELSLNAATSSNSIAGLTSLSRCHSLKKLILNLRNSQVGDLRPLGQLQGLQHLTLDLSHSQVPDLQLLKQLPGLTHLTLDLSDSQVRDLLPLEQRQGLQQLTLNLNGSQVHDLRPLGQLQGLQQLTLYLSSSQITDLQLLEQLPLLTQLTLDLSGSQVRDLRPLGQLQRLQQLTLYLSDSQATDLQLLEQMTGLTQLTLYLSGGQTRDLLPVRQLREVRELTLYLSNSEVADLQLLKQLPGLTQLTLYFRDSQARDLQLLGQLQGLQQLTLELSHGQVPDLQPLGQLQGLQQLTLNLSGFRGSQVRDLLLLGQLQRLHQLTLYLNDSQITDLQLLKQLPHLTQLTLDLSGSQVRDLLPLGQLHELQQLTLYLRGVGGSQVPDLLSIQNLNNLQKLSIEDATRTQRISLQNIPASLVELKF